jgi:hypothetical protein
MKVLTWVVAAAATGALTVGPTEWKATLGGVDHSGISGSAEMELVQPGDSRTAAPARYRVGVTILGAKPGARHGWRVRAGMCDETGVTLGAVGAYGPISVDERGGGMSSTEIGATLVPGQTYTVNVHAVGASAVIACGELKAE